MEEKKLRGVYSTESPLTASKGVTGLGGTARRLWVIWDNDEDTMLAQPLNQNLIPSGERRAIPLKEFLEEYRREPEYVIDHTSPQFSSIWKAPKDDASPQGTAPLKSVQQPASKNQTAATAPPSGRQQESLALDDTPLELGDPLPETQREPSLALDDTPLELTPPLPETQQESVAVPEQAPADATRLQQEKLEAPIKEIIQNMQDDFADGLKHLKAGRIEKAVELFEYLAGMQADFQPEHKHMFNGFGIDLRKNKIFDLAIKHYTKALDLSPSDENLYHNIARVHYEKGDVDQALKNLEKSLELNPNLRESELFWDFIIKKRRKTAEKKYKMDF